MLFALKVIMDDIIKEFSKGNMSPVLRFVNTVTVVSTDSHVKSFVSQSRVIFKKAIHQIINGVP